MTQERVQKILSRAGIASRRAAEALISAGRVMIDGRTIRELGTQADPERQRVEVDGRRVGVEPLRYLVLHKPREFVSTLNDPAGRSTVAELVAEAGVRVVPVGRLDYHTSGVLLLSNDGQFSRALLHPSTQVPREYVLKVKGPVNSAGLSKLRESIVIDGRRTLPAEVRLERNEGDKVWLMITLKEGRNRHVRRLAERAGYQVMRLARLSFAGITGEGLAPGQWRALSHEELGELKQLYGVPKTLPPRDAPVLRGTRGVKRNARARTRSPEQTFGKPTRGGPGTRGPKGRAPGRTRGHEEALEEPVRSAGPRARKTRGGVRSRSVEPITAPAVPPRAHSTKPGGRTTKESDRSTKESDRAIKQSNRSVKRSNRSVKGSNRSVKRSDRSIKQSDRSIKQSDTSTSRSARGSVTRSVRGSKSARPRGK
jgi:23S rRNA pseudouridine2605 synthase